jgi:beta-N-acetylhexosaminidase
MSLLQKISQNKNITKPVIYGVSGTSLTEEEKSFIAKSGAIGFIIFARNIENKKQLKALTTSIREVAGGEVLILVDQEGGRVARLKAPEWKSYPTGQHFADLYKKDSLQAQKELFKNFADIAQELVEVGINVDCAPVLDVLTEQTHQVIGDRAYGKNPRQISVLGKKVCEGLLSQGVYPVIKHIPGHGRGTADSHLELPVVNASLEELRTSDFIPFHELRDQKFAMTAHILFTAIDKNSCATTSKTAIDLIRNDIGFKNILMSDDISMKALPGNFTEKTNAILKAGCDLVLHCNGNMDEMREIDAALQDKNLSDKFWERFVA